ncbi:hypothetical protein F5X99DRAFT_415523 [Biscogniauxia marginata]|nr:hypothetical protein F5X99DRAFT_415523 [Biscogniauxia marginata]
MSSAGKNKPPTLIPPRGRSRKPPKSRVTTRKKPIQIASLTSRLLGLDPLNFFADNCEKIVPDWITLLRETTPPDGIASSDHRFIGAFQILDRVIVGTQGSYLLRRLAYVQYMRLSDLLKDIARSERDKGARRKSGRGDASVAIDIYQSGQEKHPHDEELRRKIYERRRTGRHLQTLAGPSPLFLLVYSSVAETIIQRSSGVNMATMAALAANARQNAPSGLAALCVRLAEMAERASRTGKTKELLNAVAGARASLLSGQ